VRVDAARNRVLVGYGKGALAIIDPATRTKAADIRLAGHPEGFQIDETGTRVFVNVPDAREIEMVELPTGGSRSFPTQDAGSNFPMAIDREAHRVLRSRTPVGVVPFDDGLHRRTGGRLKPLGAKSRCRSKIAPGWFEVIVVEAMVAGRAKISVSGAHLSSWGRVECATLK